MLWGMSPSKDIDELIANVTTAYNNYDPHTLDRVWISHQACLNEVLACDGGNHYKLPHLGKRSLMNERGVLPRSIEVSADAEETLERLKIYGDADFN
jgi:hypothetical protein